MENHSIKFRRKFLYDLITEALIAKFSTQCANDEEFFILALEVIVQNARFLFNPECKQKSSQHSIESREDGNKNFMDGRYYEAMKKYTESIVYAFDSSEELALSYANRSAVLIKLEKYTDCVNDIDRALGLQYPEKLKPKLYKRKELCLRSKKKVDLNKPLQNVSQKPLSSIIRTSNPEVPCASDAVAIEYSKKFGRHIVATRGIKPGEILAVEKPYCVVVDRENVYTHCSHCLQVSWTLIPCTKCVSAAYCSETCRDKAWNECHDIECPVLRFLDDCNICDAIDVGMRMAIIATHKGTDLDSLREELMSINCHQDPRTKGFSDDGKFLSNKYSSVYSLSQNSSNRTPKELIATALWTAFTVCVLARESHLFGKTLPLDTLTKNDDVIFVGGLILKHVHINMINVHGFGAAQGVGNDAHGHALMAFLSLLNHSCDPNVIRQWYADQMILIAVFPIQEGEQIFETYSPRFIDMEKPERQKHLENWNFECECKACLNDWPLYEELPSYKKQPIFQESKKKMNKAMRTANASFEYVVENGTIKNGLFMLDQAMKSIEIIFKLQKGPCVELYDLLDLVRSFYVSADAIYAYEPFDESDLSELLPLLYLSFQHKFFQQ